MLFKLTKNFFATCYFGLTKSAKQMRKVCCVALCLAIALGLINLPAQTVDAKITKISGWTAAPGTSSDVVRVPHPWGDYVYLRLISIKEAESWGMDTVLTIKDLPGAYAVQSPYSPIPDSTIYYPIKYSRIETNENGKKILVDDAGYSIPVGTKLFTAQGVAHSQIRTATMAQLTYTPTKEVARQLFDQCMKTNVANITPYRSAKKVTKPTLNARIDDGDERYFLSVTHWLDTAANHDELSVDGTPYMHDDKKTIFMPLTPGPNAAVQLGIDCYNDCKTKDAKGVRLKEMPEAVRIVYKIESTASLGRAIIPAEKQKKRVAAYARVSTDSDEQLTSYAAQVAFYSHYIKENPEWEFVSVYTDDGDTGRKIEYIAEK